MTRTPEDGLPHPGNCRRALELRAAAGQARSARPAPPVLPAALADSDVHMAAPRSIGVDLDAQTSGSQRYNDLLTR